MIPGEYIRVELYVPAASVSFRLGVGRLGRNRLGTITEAQWVDVTCNLVSVNMRLGGKESAISSAMGAGHLSIRARNDLNPAQDLTIHPGLPVRVLDTRWSGEPTVLWSGHLDDLYTAYDKTSGDWDVRISASDRVRDLRATTMRGGPGGLTDDQRLTARTRIEEIADRIDAPTSILDGTGGSWTLTNIPHGDWVRFGSVPTGMTLQTPETNPFSRIFNDYFTNGAAEPEITPFGFGATLQLTGLTPNALYVFQVTVQPLGQTYGRQLTDFTTFGLRATTGATGYGIPDSLLINNKNRTRRLSIGFRAGSSTVRLQLARTFEGTVSAGRDTGGLQQCRYSLSSTTLYRWNEPAGGGYPLQPVAYESSAYNQLVMACDSAGYWWCIDELGRIRARTRTFGGLEVRFSDDHTHDINRHECYIGIDRGYDTDDTVNALEFENHGRRASDEIYDAWRVADETYEHANNASINRYRRREVRLDTQLHEGHVLPRAQQLWASHAEPGEVFRSLTVDGQDRPGAVHRVKILNRVEVTHEGTTRICVVTGVRHEITPKKHTVHYELRPEHTD